ncbi:hypothetical protein B566_EDAN009487 [Ephemera danica]|nr:hypothetical protein B566_EDAN009487 [Ephemera danica]
MYIHKHPTIEAQFKEELVLFATNMSNPKRICLNASRNPEDERTIRTKGNHTKLKAKYDTKMRIYKVTSETMLYFKETMEFRRKNLLTKGCTGSCYDKCNGDCKIEHFKIEHKQKEVLVCLKAMENEIFNYKQTLDHMSVEMLHDYDCTESDDCLLRMQRVLNQDPLSLERKREIQDTGGSITCDGRQSPLHDAVSKGHIKCIKFLLENGARVNSLTTLRSNTVLHTLYETHEYSQQRLEILTLLLQYGFSCSLEDAGEYALKSATAADEVSLLLNHGAILLGSELRNLLYEVWLSYDLQLVKLYLLTYSKRINLAIGYQDLCQGLVQQCYKKMILAKVPLDVCHQKLLEALKLYKAFGGKFPVCQSADPDQDLMQYLICFQHRRHFDGIVSRIETLVSNPMSLKEISRLAVRKCIQKNYLENIKQLEAPEDLQPFLRFDDIIVTERPDDYDYDSTYNSSGSDGSEDENDSDNEEDEDIYIVCLCEDDAFALSFKF